MQRRKFLTASGLSILGIKGLIGNAGTSPEIKSKKRSQTIKTKVLVVGGGPAGIGAAIGAAKAGAETLLIENYGFFGGVASWSIGMCINQMRPDEKPRGYVHELIIRKLQDLGPQAVKLSTHQLYVNVEYLKVAVLDALDEAGCKYLVHTKAVDVLTEGHTGHAAGVAAALSSKTKKTPRELNVKKIQEILTNDGVDLNKGGETQDKNIAN